ncbi:uncharacterized protein LOC135395877 [Ornithodoros turicata]|uniref:uncharacterized protein LOC135395877 n=1 Tax=Ornithodoros turicata TaxID=34597 RepID=UPI003139C35D
MERLKRTRGGTLQIPKFSGKLQEWQQFWEHFDVSIHSNQALAAVEKFKYLASYLVDDARRTIEGIRINGDNYPTAIAALKHRYGRPGLLTSEHIDALLALRPVNCSGQVSQLRHLLDQVSFRTSALAALDVPKEHYAVIHERVITRCLPEDLCVLFRQRRVDATDASRRERGGDDATDASRRDRGGGGAVDTPTENVEALISFLKVQVETREEVALTRATGQANQRPSRSPSILPSPATASALAATSGRSPGLMDHQLRSSSRPPCDSCPLCGSTDHPLQSCTVYLPTADKKPDRQMFSMRETWSSFETVQNGSAVVLRQLPRPAPFCTPYYDITSLKSAEYWGNCSAANCYSLGVWPGGQKQLRCEVEGEENLSVFSFAATHPKHYRCEQVTVRLESLFESDSVVDLTALCVDDLCHVVVPPLGIKTIRVMQERGLPFADTCHTAEIGVLVGADQYWKVVTGHVERLAADLIAVETIFGWIVQNVRGTISSLVSVFFLAHEDQDHFESIDPSEMWRLDALGIADHVAGDDDSVASLCFSSQVEKRNGRYVVPLMVKGSGLPAEANNRVTAAQRLVAQLRRFRSSPQLLLNYDSVIREYFDEGHAERVADVSNQTDNVYYMPHHAVIRKDAVTTKRRVVFDASSHCPGQPSPHERTQAERRPHTSITSVSLQHRRPHGRYKKGVSTNQYSNR